MLPGVDDGPRTLSESVALARTLVADGVSIAAATPHVSDEYPTRPETMEEGLSALRDALAAEQIPLDVRSGGEVSLDMAAALEPADRGRFGLAGNPHYLLLELPSFGWPLELPTRVFRLLASGVTPVLAHPERNDGVRAAPELLVSLVEAGALVQITAASLAGGFGRRTQRTAFRLLELGLVHLAAGDSHGGSIRRAPLSAVAGAIGDVALTRWLTDDVPAAIVEDAPVPGRPARARRRLRFSLAALHG